MLRQTHEYADKFLLAEFLTSTCLAGILNCLELVGVDVAKLETMRGWAAADKSVTLEFSLTESCEFKKKETKDIDSASKRVTESNIGKTQTQVWALRARPLAPTVRVNDASGPLKIAVTIDCTGSHHRHRVLLAVRRRLQDLRVRRHRHWRPVGIQGSRRPVRDRHHY